MIKSESTFLAPKAILAALSYLQLHPEAHTSHRCRHKMSAHEVKIKFKMRNLKITEHVEASLVYIVSSRMAKLYREVFSKSPPIVEQAGNCVLY